MHQTLRSSLLGALSGLALLVSCGEEPKKETVTIEGTVYLSPISTLESALTSELSSVGEIKLAQKKIKVLDEGTARLVCTAQQTLEGGCPSNEYIESAVSRGKYKIETTSKDITEGGPAICAEDKNGKNKQCAIPNPIKPYKSGDYVPPKITQDLSQETTAHFQLTIGSLQEAKQEFGKITKTLFGNLWGGAGDLYKDVIEFFKQHQSTLDVKSYFDRLFEDEKELKDVGDIYKKNTGSKRDSYEIGKSVGERAEKVDLGEGNVIVIEETDKENQTTPKIICDGFCTSTSGKLCCRSNKTGQGVECCPPNHPYSWFGCYATFEDACGPQYPDYCSPVILCKQE